MRLISRIFIVLVLITQLYSQEYEENKIIIKFKEGNEFQRWFLNPNEWQVDEFEELLGEYSTRQIIRKELINAIERKLRNKSLLFRSNSYKVNSLRRIAVIEYNSGINPLIVAKKIKGYDFIEYAEPIPIKRIVGVPNDSLIYNQYYLNQIRIFEAWDSTFNDSTIVIGIVDTGVDFNHEDLKDKIWQNLGEMGIDETNKDKSTNGIDDDGNGFIDDWRGWDFVSSEFADGDNDPTPGHQHGTHIAGISAAITNNVKGIAGISKGGKILAVKVGSDNPFSTSVQNSYEGILYAAVMGADVINCSWGSESRTDSEKEIIEIATELGSLIVSAAGNDGKETKFFPASYKEVLSVSAVDWNDKKAGFSNYDLSVDVAAPGVDIFSTIPGNDYTAMDGTSMATPIVTGVAAIAKAIHPEFTPIQLKEFIKSSTDNIDSLNPQFIGKIGRGRVNALKIVSNSNAKSIIVDDYAINEEIPDGILELNEKIYLDLILKNVLLSVSDLMVKIQFLDIYKPKVEKDYLQIGKMETDGTKIVDSAFTLVLPEETPPDYEIPIELLFYDGDEYINSEFLSIIINPSYRTMRSNNISVTLNSRGNIAFNDYPLNFQGEGFKYKGSDNLLYEGALMVSLLPDKISDVARGYDQMRQNSGFYTEKAIEIKRPGLLADEESFSEYLSYEDDINLSSKVFQSAYQFNEVGLEDIIFVVYDIVNISEKDYDSLYVALYFDWDIGLNGEKNKVFFDSKRGFGYIKNMAIDSLPKIGFSMLSAYELNYYAIDNGANSIESIGVWDGFDRNEKIIAMSSGIYRTESSVTDASVVIGAGPINLKVNDTARVTFALFADNNVDDLRFKNEIAWLNAKNIGLADGTYNPLPEKDSVLLVYPNPLTGNELTVEYLLETGGYVSIDLFNIIGQFITILKSSRFETAGKHISKLKIDGLPKGRYYLRINTPRSFLVAPFEIY